MDHLNLSHLAEISRRIQADCRLIVLKLVSVEIEKFQENAARVELHMSFGQMLE
jgi:hypothetical protein